MKKYTNIRNLEWHIVKSLAVEIMVSYFKFLTNIQKIYEEIEPLRENMHGQVFPS